MTDFEKAQIRFLQILAVTENGARRRDLPPASRKNDLVRQTCRRNGWCVYADAGQGMRWYITAKGRKVFERMEAE